MDKEEDRGDLQARKHSFYVGSREKLKQHWVCTRSTVHKSIRSDAKRRLTPSLLPQEEKIREFLK